MYAPKQTFDAWDGILFPLMLNGYVKDKAMFDDISVFKIDELARAATFYGAMVDTKLYSEFAALTTLTEEANKALRNGTTISNCLLSDNCDITYNANGEAEPNYTNN